MTYVFSERKFYFFYEQYILLINREWRHYREISDRGLDVLTSVSLGQYIKAEVWDFPVMTKRRRLISIYYMAFLTLFLERIQKKTVEVIFSTSDLYMGQKLR